MRAVTTCLVLVLLLNGCSDSDDRSPRGTSGEQPGPRVSQGAPRCPGQEAISRADMTGGSLTGHVDPDLEDDEVFIVVDPQADPGCRFLLVVETGRGAILSTPIDTGDVEPIGGLPALDSLVRIDERPGAEIVVDVLAGASTTFAAVFSTGGGTLERMRISGGGPYGDLFPYGGSAGHMESTWCAPIASSDDGYAAMGLIEPRGDGYLITETTYRTVDGFFEPVDERAERIGSLDELGERWESFANSAFGNCPSGT